MDPQHRLRGASAGARPPLWREQEAILCQAVDVRAHVPVDDNEAALVDLDARAVEADVLGTRSTPDRHDHHVDRQQLLTDLDKHRDAATVALFVVGAVILAPLVEELLFRGVLLRALLRKFDPPVAVLVSALVFALVHYIGDPHTLPFLPALAGLGAVLAVTAVRTGDLSASIFIHAGFNLTTTVLFLASGAKLS